MSRILAACIGVFGLVNGIAGLFRTELDANGWWIDLNCGSSGFARVFIAGTCGLMLAYAIAPEMNSFRRISTIIAAAILATACVANCATYYSLLSRGAIHSTLPIPLSILFASAFLWVAFSVLTHRTSSFELKWAVVIPTLLAMAIGFPLAQIFFFGKTDYSRPADVAVVFGARAYADGSPSQALADRVRTGCDLYKRGLVKTLIFSGGPGDGAFHETDTMRALAVKWGVRNEDIQVDRNGLNTRATLENLCATRDASKWQHPRILAVSHFYHLPRIKLESQRLGIEVFTVPAKETYTLTKMPILIAREVAAIWAHYCVPPACALK